MTPKDVVQTSAPYVGAAEKAAVARVLDSGYYGCGPEVATFEHELSYYLGNDIDVVCTASGTAALHLALTAIGVGHGDEVLAPSVTFVATFQAIAATGARPVACDVLEKNLLLDIEDARRRITQRTRAVIPVHYAGHSGDLDAIYDFARSNRLRVVEDAAHAFGSRNQGRMIGSFGDVVCFSFDPIKNITAGQGGAVVTRNPAVAHDVRLRRELGIERASTTRSDDIVVSRLGWRYAMSDLMAAIGRVQLGRFDSELKPLRQQNAAALGEKLRDLPDIGLPSLDAEDVPHIFPVRIANDRRDVVRKALRDAGFETKVHYPPNHLLPYFADGAPRPVAERAFQELLTLPLHPGIGDDQIAHMVSVIRASLSAPMNSMA